MHARIEPRKLAVVGCGPKALSIAAKARVLKDLGIADIDVTVYEKYRIAAYWTGSFGFTDGLQLLGTPPEKDIGFPYRSHFGKLVDQELLKYSWNAFLIDRQVYGAWIDRNKPHPTHREWASYLQWVAERINVDLRRQEITSVVPEDSGFQITAQKRDGSSSATSSGYVTGVVFTGPGHPLKIHDHQDHEWSEDIINGQNFWQRIAIFSHLDDSEIAIVGSGETAASIVTALLDTAPEVRINIINRHGTLYTRGESYHENRYFTDPTGWHDLDIVDRDDFMRRTDRGVFSVASKKYIDTSNNITVITGNVRHLESNGDSVSVHVQRLKGNVYETFVYTYKKVIVAIGFDALSALEVLPDHMRPRKKAKYIREKIDTFLRIPRLDTEDGEDLMWNIHMPMMAGLSQGPGFSNLSCLGELSEIGRAHV